MPPFRFTVCLPVIGVPFNVLRHSAAASYTIEVAVTGGWLRLMASNDGAPSATGDSHPATGDGSGLGNLTARQRTGGGRLATRQAGSHFQLTAEFPLPATATLSGRSGQGDPR